MSRLNFNLFKVWFIVCLLAPGAGFSQSTLTGIITDRLTGEPVPYANVFFSQTTIGSSSLEDGSFVIRNIPNGKYDLLVFVVGYQRYKQPLEFQGKPYEFNISLRQDTVNLAAVMVYGDQSDRKFYPTFEKYFLGEGANSKKCEINNPETLHFYYDSKANCLTVHASEPVIVDNVALGYRLHYILDRFELNFKTAIKVIEGIPRFEELPYTGARDSINRVRKRTKAYLGSLNHFMRSLYSNTLKKQGFLVDIADSVSREDYPNNIGKLYPLNVAKRMKGAVVKTLYFKGKLSVQYIKAYEPMEYAEWRANNRPQTTYITFVNPSLTLFENGYYTDQLGIFLEGYLVWAETAGNLLPIGYNVPVKQKRK